MSPPIEPSKKYIGIQGSKRVSSAGVTSGFDARYQLSPSAQPSQSARSQSGAAS